MELPQVSEFQLPQRLLDIPQLSFLSPPVGSESHRTGASTVRYRRSSVHAQDAHFDLRHDLDGKTLNELNEIDTLNREAQESLKELKGRSRQLYSISSQTMDTVPRNDAKFEEEWRMAMREPMPLYFRPDGT